MGRRAAAKQTAAAGSPQAQKRKKAAVEKGVGLSAKRQAVAVAAAFQDAELLPASVREMLASMVPQCFPAEHPYQKELLGFAVDALRGVEGSLLANVTKAEAVASSLAQKASELKRVEEFASRELSQSVKALAAEEEALRSAEAALRKAKEDLKSGEAELRSCDKLIGTAAMERHQLESMASDPASVDSELLAKFVRGSQCKDMIDQINEATLSRDQSIRVAAASRVSIHTSIETAKLTCEAGTTQLQLATAAHEKASKTRHACAEQMRAAWDAARDFPMQQTKADAEVKACNAKLKAFQNGPLAFVSKAMEGTSTTSATDASPQGKPLETRRLSFAEVRRRRTSFVPRKRVAMRASGDDDDEEELDKVPTNQPKEASDCRSGGA